jgi:hypothetical protein
VIIGSGPITPVVVGKQLFWHGIQEPTIGPVSGFDPQIRSDLNQANSLKTVAFPVLAKNP